MENVEKSIKEGKTELEVFKLTSAITAEISIKTFFGESID